MNLKLTTLFLGLIAHGSVFAAATISAPEEIIVVALNGQTVKSGLFKGKKQFKVEAGQVNLNVRYQEYFEMHNGRFDIIKSDVVNIRVPELKDNQNYSLALVNPPKDEEEGKKFAQSPQIAIYDQNKKLVQIQQQSTVQNESPSILGGLFSKDDNSSRVYSTQEQSSTPTSSISSKVEQPIRTKTTVQSGTSEQELIKIWQQSSKSDRQKFLSWLAEQ